MKKSDINPMPEFFDRYINLAEEEALISSLERNLKVLETLDINSLKSIGDKVYEPDKWTIKDIFQHLIDNERIQSYRALRIARKDTTILPGYDENLLASNTNTKNQSLEDLLNEFILVRKSSILLFKSFTNEMLLRKGFCFKVEISALALGFQLSGHQIHHLKVINDKYKRLA